MPDPANLPLSPEIIVIGAQTVVAALITIALLWYARLFRETERRARQIETLNDIALTINASLDLSEAFRSVTTSTRRLIPFDRACIAFLDDAGDAFDVVANTARPSAAVTLPTASADENGGARERIQRDTSAAGWAVSHSQAWISHNLEHEHHRPDAGVLWSRSARWCMALPLSLRGEAIGVFSLSGDERLDLGDDTLEALQLIAEQVAIATANAQLYAETRALARDLEKRVEERTRELRETQEQMMRSEKLAVATQLAAAIAHEINNPLQSMRLYVELLAADQQGDAEAQQEYVDVIQGQVDRIASIVSRLLKQLYQPAEEALVPVDFNAMITDLMGLFERQFRNSHITLELALSETLSPVTGAPNGLRQVCLNVLLNAIEAMSDGGKLRIATELKNDRAYVTFADSGVGIDPEVVSRVFDPFYTTKPHGTGLGLTVSYRIIQEHGGDLAIESRPGAGTTVHVILPVDGPSGQQAAPTREQRR
ncbi:MAG: Sporulation kinase E [Anaerolineales bacterium]|nr:Sporulation kinase E [Anaerolineales bacterium]